jgi:hypothetical protein
MAFRYRRLCGKASDTADGVRSANPTGFPFGVWQVTQRIIPAINIYNIKMGNAQLGSLYTAVMVTLTSQKRPYKKFQK